MMRETKIGNVPKVFGYMSSFFVAGQPVTKGSTKSFPSSTTGKMVTIPASKFLGSWEARIALTARGEWEGPLLTGPVLLSVSFFFPRPQSHYRHRRRVAELRDDAPVYVSVTKRHDLDKLLRALFDGLTGIVYDDDARVSALGMCFKMYCTPAHPAPGVLIQIADLSASDRVGAARKLSGECADADKN